MNAPLSPAVLLDAVRRAKQQRLAEGNLIEFTRQAFEIIEPGIPFVDSWHLHAMAEHLEAVSEGEIEYLVVNIPPGCMKSILVSVSWPAWEWISVPGLRVLGASYGADLAIRDAAKCRDIITSAWYQERWSQVQVRKGSDQKTKYELTSGGWRMATSVGGRATGEHPDRKIIDDPHSAAQADSDAERSTALVWHDRTLSTRGASRGARTVLVMQRLHEQDMTGHVLATEHNAVHLCLPMEYEQTKKIQTVVGWEDPRTKSGSLLWPEMFDSAKVAKLKRLLGEYGTAGQLQQRPAPAGGGILKTKHFQLFKSAWPMPHFEHIVQSYDGAYDDDATSKNDPSACSTWGVFTQEGKRGALLLDVWAEHYGYPKFRKKVIEEWRDTRYGGDEKAGVRGQRADVVLVEKKSSGQSILQDLRAANVPALPYVPTVGKVPRAHNVAPILELDCLYIPESKKDPGEFVTWARPFVEQCAKFPNAEHDDMVDTFTQSMIYLRDSGHFDLDVVEQEEPEELDYSKKKRANPYAS